MARVTAPLLSLSASGKIADVMVASTWKGIPVMRQYVKPSNPNTAAQSAHRALMTACVYVWRNTFTNAIMRTSWNRLALLLADTMSGFNAFIRNAVGIASTNADASFCLSVAAAANYKAVFTMKNLDDGATGDEAGNFEIWYGSSPDSLLKLEATAIAAGTISSVAALGTAAGVVYTKLRKDGFDRSGLVALTLILA